MKRAHHLRWLLALGTLGTSVVACTDDAADRDTAAPDASGADTTGVTDTGTSGNETIADTSAVETLAETSADTVAETSSETSADTVAETSSETSGETSGDTGAPETTSGDTTTASDSDAETTEPLDYNMFSQEISIGYYGSGSQPTNCAIAIPMGPIPADAGIRVPIVQFLESTSGATKADTTLVECGTPDTQTCPNAFTHDVMARDGALADVLDPLAQELAGHVSTSVFDVVLHADGVDYDAVVLAGRLGDKVVGIAFIAGVPYCGID